ncbi:hypothetical protein CYMTET_50638 [Cymbomonas tetramitiformis]|uniref:Uncharacterized protein n=1 Tax=Cymbomonas tetramitiformis TaxID=36881 RepID=A0AAE0ESL8_9CHLO|nr:hypothetical protein CYMTET_50638 [Cymbomonas tetramitiformis]
MLYKEVNNSLMMVGMKAILDGELMSSGSMMKSGQEIVQFIIAIQPGLVKEAYMSFNMTIQAVQSDLLAAAQLL